MLAPSGQIPPHLTPPPSWHSRDNGMCVAGALVCCCCQVLWGVSDYGAKVVFSSHLWQKNLATVQKRREAAQELMGVLDRCASCCWRCPWSQAAMQRLLGLAAWEGGRGAAAISITHHQRL